MAHSRSRRLRDARLRPDADAGGRHRTDTAELSARLEFPLRSLWLLGHRRRGQQLQRVRLNRQEGGGSRDSRILAPGV